MSGNNSNNNRFPLPENWDVDEFICMVIPVPDDADYIAIMRGLIDTLTWARSFEQHPTENAARQVADTWAEAFASKEISFQGCNMPDFRINEDTCLLEVNCGTPDVPNWRPVFTPDYQASFDFDPPTLYPDDPPVGQTKQCLAAANCAAMLKNGCTNFANLLSTTGVFGEIISGLYTLLVGVVDVSLTDLWSQSAALWMEFNPSTIEADLAAFDFDMLKNKLACEYSADGSMDYDHWLNVSDWLFANAGISDNQIWVLLHFVWGLMGQNGATMAARWGNITDATCEDCGDWCRNDDFTVSDGGWAHFTGWIQAWGVYNSGVGWSREMGELCDNGQIWGRETLKHHIGGQVNYMKFYLTNYNVGMRVHPANTDCSTIGSDYVYTNMVGSGDFDGTYYVAEAHFDPPIAFSDLIIQLWAEGSGDYALAKLDICGPAPEPPF